MTNVLHGPIDFHPRPVSYAPSPFGFGFGLGQPSSPAMFSGVQHSTAQSASSFTHFNPPSASSFAQQSPLRPQKRRYEPEENQDDAMERSPTPGDRPKRAPPKRLRQHEPQPPRGQEISKENKAPSEDSEIDIGVLLARLPSQSLLPLLTSLLSQQPSLKTSILPLIPRPTVQIALQALAESAKKLRDAYPYSHSAFSQPPPPSPQPQSSFSSSIGFGFGSASRTSAFGQTSTTFGNTSFSAAQSHNNGTGMRDDYVLSRVRPHITDFISAAISYLPYFSFIASSTEAPTAGASQSPATTLRGLHRGKAQPSETFTFLEALTTHMLSQPPLALSVLAPQLLPRLIEEWKAWVAKVDEVVNREGGMFGKDAVEGWMRSLDAFAQCKDVRCAQAVSNVRQELITKVGWLVGRVAHHPMEEL